MDGFKLGLFVVFMGVGVVCLIVVWYVFWKYWWCWVRGEGDGIVMVLVDCWMVVFLLKVGYVVELDLGNGEISFWFVKFLNVKFGLVGFKVMIGWERVKVVFVGLLFFVVLFVFVIWVGGLLCED